MKGIYLSNTDPRKAQGYISKVLGQVKGFNQLGIDIGLVCFGSDYTIIFSEYKSKEGLVKRDKLYQFSKTSSLVIRRLRLYEEVLKIINHNCPDFVFLRHPRSDPLFICFLSILKKYNPYIKVFSEIPTYPYDQEYQNSRILKDKILYFLDKRSRCKLKRYIDRIIVVSYDYSIFDIPTINISNGICVSQFELSKRPQFTERYLHMIGIGNIDFWHGYDRIIQGLRCFYDIHGVQEKQLFFHVVSPMGNTVQELIKITQAYGLSDFVIFHGERFGSELDQVVDQCHIAIGDLGCHRKGVKETAALKVREYVARGMPFVSSAEDPDFSNLFPYRLKLPANDHPIEMQKMIDFTKVVYRDLNHSQRLRDYAINNLDWSIKLEKVVYGINSLGN